MFESYRCSPTAKGVRSNLWRTFSQHSHRHRIWNRAVIMKSLPDFVSELLASLEFYESPPDMSELPRTFGVKTTSLHDFVRGFVAAQA